MHQEMRWSWVFGLQSYHSGIPAKDRNRIQELFCSNKLRVVRNNVDFNVKYLFLRTVLFIEGLYAFVYRHFILILLCLCTCNCWKVVATVAFGMGLDKSDVGAVCILHSHMILLVVFLKSLYLSWIWKEYKFNNMCTFSSCFLRSNYESFRWFIIAYQEV